MMFLSLKLNIKGFLDLLNLAHRKLGLYHFNLFLRSARQKINQRESRLI